MVDDDCAFIQELDEESRNRLRPASCYCRSVWTYDVRGENHGEEEHEINSLAFQK